MAGELKGRKVAILATDGVEESELVQPRDALVAAGAETCLVSLKDGTIQGMEHGENRSALPVDATISSVHARDFDALLLPGGRTSPRTLSDSAEAVAFAKSFMESDKPVAAICHGPLLLVAADAVNGRTLTSTPKVKNEVTAAGATWVDRAVQLDQKLLTSRGPDDLPQFCAKLISMLTIAIDERRLDKMVEQSFPASDPLPGPTTI